MRRRTIPDEDVEEMAANADMDGDGVLGIEEFEDMVKKMIATVREPEPGVSYCQLLPSTISYYQLLPGKGAEPEPEPETIAIPTDPLQCN